MVTLPPEPNVLSKFPLVSYWARAKSAFPKLSLNVDPAAASMPIAADGDPGGEVR